MKTLLKIVGGGFALLVVAGAVFWFGWCSPPATEEVCSNLAEIAKKENPEVAADVIEMTKTTCMKEYKQGNYEGLLRFTKRSKCRVAAESSEEFDACSKET